MKIAMIGLRGIPAAYGGVERAVESMSTRLAAHGHEVTVYCRSASLFPQRRFYRQVRLVTLPTLRQKHLEMPIYASLAFLAARAAQFDVVHVHSVDPLFFCLDWRRQRLVCTSQGQVYRRRKWGRLAKSVSLRAERKFLRVTWAPIAVSRTLKQHYEAMSGREVIFIPNGAEIMPKLPAEPLTRFGLAPQGYFLFVGRLEPSKGCHHLIEAYRRTGLRTPLVVMGGSTYTRGYMRSLRETAPSTVRFIGHQSGMDYWTVLQHARLALFPTEIEGMSVALLEAMGQALPVIYSDIPENCEVADGVGLSFPCNDVEHLAAQLKALDGSPECQRKLGELARDRVKREYNWDRITSEQERVYADVLGGRLRPPAGGG